ncbi:MAG: TVP38/TMEM64 family protein [Desulfovibrio sp.]|nr:TVP38/TMEM64 family protein [Desulfovibrio sp.]MBI4961509.1 TVP38/TMEM64 family protein [Desulfovibrio sp.]
MTTRKTGLALSLVLFALVAAFAAWTAHADAILSLVRFWAGYYKGFVLANPATCWLGILAVGAVIINCPVPVAALVKVLAGFFFGVQAGMALNVFVSVLGGLLGFMATRHLFHRPLYSRFSHQLARVNLDIARNGFWYVLSARLLMVTPFFLVNVLSGLSCIRKRKFLLGTFLGVIPSSAIYAVSGSHLESIRTASDMASPQFAFILALLAAVSVVPALIRRKKRKPA